MDLARKSPFAFAYMIRIYMIAHVTNERVMHAALRRGFLTSYGFPVTEWCLWYGFNCLLDGFYMTENEAQSTSFSDSPFSKAVRAKLVMADSSFLAGPPGPQKAGMVNSPSAPATAARQSRRSSAPKGPATIASESNPEEAAVIAEPTQPPEVENPPAPGKIAKQASKKKLLVEANPIVGTVPSVSKKKRKAAESAVPTDDESTADLGEFTNTERKQPLVALRKAKDLIEKLKQKVSEAELQLETRIMENKSLAKDKKVSCTGALDWKTGVMIFAVQKLKDDVQRLEVTLQQAQQQLTKPPPPKATAPSGPSDLDVGKALKSIVPQVVPQVVEAVREEIQQMHEALLAALSATEGKMVKTIKRAVSAGTQTLTNAI